MEEYIEVQAGQVIIEQGQLDKGFYILETGIFEVIKDGVLLSVLKHPGTIFGEMGDFLDEPRTCTVKAKEAGKVIHVVADDMRKLIQENPDVGLAIIKTLTKRLKRTTQKLAQTAKDSPVYSLQK